MSRIVLFLFFLLIFSNSLKAQNLVPNPSFEELRDLPVKPNPKKTFSFEPNSGYIPYQRNLNYWFAATATSPDLRIHHSAKYNECRRKYKKCDKAHSGGNCVGIITYMGNKNTDTYREYVQVKLKKNLRPNVKTYVEFWITKEREAKLVSNNIGCYFSMKKTKMETMETLPFEPQINVDSLINTEKKEWIKIEQSFIPDGPFKFLLIGNFFRNEKTEAEKFPNYNSSTYIPPYAYYLIDDVRVWQEGDKAEAKPIVFEEKEIKANEPIQLKNIEFEYDRSVLITRSYVELEKLLNFLKKYPEVKIAIHGHTDDRGKDAYNLKLSKERAAAVEAFLQSKGIETERLKSEGFGETQPILSNETKEGRSKNRRVEFLIIED